MPARCRARSISGGARASSEGFGRCPDGVKDEEGDFAARQKKGGAL